MTTTIVSFQPQFSAPPVAPPVTWFVLQDSFLNTFNPQVTVNGNPVTASLTITLPTNNGIINANGASLLYEPFGGYFGPDSATYTATYLGQTSAPAPIAITVLPTKCDEMGRVTRAYVSAYQRNRVHRSDLVRGEVRCLAAEFRGAINPNRVIASVDWWCQQPYCIFMSNPRIAGTECAVTINAQAASWCYIKVVATLDNGEQYTQLFYLSVRSPPYFVGENFPTASGPTHVAATNLYLTSGIAPPP